MLTEEELAQQKGMRYRAGIDERLAKLEDKNNINSDESRFKLLEMRTENLREDMNCLLELLCEVNSIPGRPSNFKLKLLTVTYDDIREIHRILEEHRKQIFHKVEKKPFKCLPCEGSTKTQYRLPGGGYWEENCKSCDGKGIIWG